MSDSTPSSARSRPSILSRVLLVPLAIVLILLFIALLFPWDSLGRRIAWEISRGSGARVEVPNLSPAFTARGPVLRATDVTIEHPAVDRVRLTELEIAPRFATSWFAGDPTLRLWAKSGLGDVDGVLRLGDAPAYLGRAERVELSRLPLRLDATGLKLKGPIQADADVALDPNGTLAGQVDFQSDALSILSDSLPMELVFSDAHGRVEILDSGATRITDVELLGPVVEARIDGEIGLVHRSQSPPVDLNARLKITNPLLRQLAPNIGLTLSRNGEAFVHVSGTIDAPEVQHLNEAPQQAARDRSLR